VWLFSNRPRYTTPQHLNQKRDIKKATSNRTTQKHKERKALASTVPKKKIKTTQVEPHNPVAITLYLGKPRPKRTSTELAREISTRPKKKRKKEPLKGSKQKFAKADRLTSLFYMDGGAHLDSSNSFQF
jgi:hypothetical protein